jgi:hypothetical protein
MAEKRPVTSKEFLEAAEVDDEWSLSGPELARVFWTVKQRESDRERDERYWLSVREALTTAYEQLERKTAELDELKGQLLRANEGLERRVAHQVSEIVAHMREVEVLNVQLQARVRERSRELMTALRRAGSWNTASSVTPGTIVGQRARVVRPLGEGGMGAVYAAEDLLTGRPVALKLLRNSGERALRYFVAEAEAASAVSHPAIVRTLHVDVTDDGQIFQLMELVDGSTLAERLRGGPVTSGEAARIVSIIALALAAAHEHGIIHRDIKPSNVLLCREAPGVRVLDFGVAKRTFGESDTVTEALVGTPMYMSPDQIRSPANVTPAADVYSLGVILFELLSGRRPFEGSSIESVLFGHLNEVPVKVSYYVPEVPAELAAITEECLSKEPGQRRSAAALGARLAELADADNAPPGEQIGRQAWELAQALEETSYDSFRAADTPKE